MSMERGHNGCDGPPRRTRSGSRVRRKGSRRWWRRDGVAGDGIRSMMMRMVISAQEEVRSDEDHDDDTASYSSGDLTSGDPLATTPPSTPPSRAPHPSRRSSLIPYCPHHQPGRLPLGAHQGSQWTTWMDVQEALGHRKSPAWRQTMALGMAWVSRSLGGWGDWIGEDWWRGLHMSYPKDLNLSSSSSSLIPNHSNTILLLQWQTRELEIGQMVYKKTFPKRFGRRTPV